jgi:hypothetical protein
VEGDARKSIRTVTKEDFARLKSCLLKNATVIARPSQFDPYEGVIYELPDEELFGFRMSEHGETIDIFKRGTQLLDKRLKVHQK